MYKKVFLKKVKDNKYLVHLWQDSGYSQLMWKYPAYFRTSSETQYKDLNGNYLQKVLDWKKDDAGLIFNDMPPYQRFLIDYYGDNQEMAQSYNEVFFDIEIEMGGALTNEYIKSAPKPVTSIAWYHKQLDQWGLVILDPKSQIQTSKVENKEIISCKTEQELLLIWLEKLQEMEPDVLIGYNSDYFDIPYLTYRIKRVLGDDAMYTMSPIREVRDISDWRPDTPIQIGGLECLDFLQLHKNFSQKAEPTYKLSAIGKKYVNLDKIEYEGTLDMLFKSDINKFIEYNFRDVEIIVELDKKLNYLNITKNIANKGRINLSEVTISSRILDGAISNYLLNQNIIPPSKDINQVTKAGFAGGFIFCPEAGLFSYEFDLDLESLYPGIMRTLNMGKETYVGRIIYEEDRTCSYSAIDIKDMDRELIIENAKGKQTQIHSKDLYNLIIDNKFAVSANGVMFRTDFKSVFAIILEKWFKERVDFKNLMKKYYKEGNKEEGDKYNFYQWAVKILLNSLFGSTALKSFRYGSSIMSEAITLTGWRVIQGTAKCINTNMNLVMNDKIKL